MSEFRTEKDSMGSVKVPVAALYSAQTQRAVDNFPISGLSLPRDFIQALALIKICCAETNQQLGLLDDSIANAIVKAAEAVAAGDYDAEFPVDVFQTGSGTSSNMNMNEVVANLARQQGSENIHPNDHVNMSQSSNDVIPTAIHISACLAIENKLKPALRHLYQIIEARAEELKDTVKTGRTHLMDAMPVTFGQELSGWAEQIKYGLQRLDAVMPRILELAQGGTAVGTGINCPPQFPEIFCQRLTHHTQLKFKPKPNLFEGLSTQDAAVELSGQLRTIAVSLMKIANDLRWGNSGPLTGLGDITLPALQPGSSIMPGKVNPVIPEATAMVCVQVIGNDVSIAVAGQSGNFQLNVMLPLIAYNLLQSIDLLANCSFLMADKTIAGFSVNTDNITSGLACNPILVTALNRVIGYEEGARIAKKAYAEKRTVLDVAVEETSLSEQELRDLLDPLKLVNNK